MRRAVMRVAGGMLALMMVAVPATAEDAAWAPSMGTGSANQVNVSLLEGGLGYVFVGDADVPGSRLLRTDDGGVTYSSVTTSDHFGPFTRMRFVAPETGWAADRSLRRTDDGGRTWAEVAEPEAPEGWHAYWTDALDATADGVVAIGGDLAADGACGEERERRAVVAVSADAGASWSLLDLGLEGRVLDVHVPADGAGAVVVHGSRTTSAPSGPLGLPLPVGIGCVTSYSSLPGAGAVLLLDGEGAVRPVLECGDADCHQVARPTSEQIVVGMGDGTVRVSEDAGATFTAARFLPEGETAGLPVVVTGIELQDARTVFLSTAGHGVFRSDDGGLSWVSELSPRTVVGTGRGDLAVAPDGGALVAGPLGVLRRVGVDG